MSVTFRAALRPALFLDRDGVINVDHAYVHRSADFRFIDGIFDLCRAAAKLGYRMFVVTNQAGIGRGYYTEQQFLTLTEWMRNEFSKEGVAIDKVYFCPSHPVHGVGQYKVESSHRKPGPGMILQAAEEFGIDLAQSVLIGDKESDIEAGLAAGLRATVLYAPVDAAPDAADASRTKASFVAPTLDAVRAFLDQLDDQVNR
ncbi:MAG: HAD family hydrolase [Pseudomonadota bacterium]